MGWRGGWGLEAPPLADTSATEREPSPAPAEPNKND